MSNRNHIAKVKIHYPPKRPADRNTAQWTPQPWIVSEEVYWRLKEYFEEQDKRTEGNHAWRKSFYESKGTE